MIEIFNKLKQYNFWQNNKLDTGFKRHFYLDKIMNLADNRLIKVLVGQRRAGKSYILRQIMKQFIDNGVNPENTFYLNKEVADFNQIKNFVDLNELVAFYKKKINVKGKVYIFLDEVQQISEWEKVVNSFSQDYKYEYEVFISGSNSKMLSGELATLLTGRYVPFEIFPFSYGEFTEYFGLDHKRDTFIQYLKTGGLPELFRLADHETKVYYVASLLDTILVKDIVKRYKIQNVKLLYDLFKYISDTAGGIFSIVHIVNYLNNHKIYTNIHTVSNYIKYLLETFLIHEVDRYDIKGKSVFSRGKKYYLNDLAFRNFLSSNFDAGLGSHLENYIYLHYKRLGYKVYVGKILNKEIDFVIEKPKEKKYIQVVHSLSSDEVIEREFGNLEKIRDNYEKLVISLDDVSYGNREGIKHVVAWDL